MIGWALPIIEVVIHIVGIRIALQEVAPAIQDLTLVHF